MRLFDDSCPCLVNWYVPIVLGEFLAAQYTVRMQSSARARKRDKAYNNSTRKRFGSEQNPIRRILLDFQSKLSD